MSDHPKDTHGRVADETAPGVPKGSNVLYVLGRAGVVLRLSERAA
jgi:hypothetical protein